MRIYETNAANESLSFSLMEQLPSESVEALDRMEKAVSDAASALTATEVTHLHNVKHSPRLVVFLGIRTSNDKNLTTDNKAILKVCFDVFAAFCIKSTAKS